MKNPSLKTQCENFHNLIESSQFSSSENEVYSRETANEVALGLLNKVKCSRSNVYIVGNGGNASIASYICNDLFNAGSIRASTLNETTTLTRFSNNYGYENSYSMTLHKIADKQDLLIAISGTGQSQNILNSALLMRNKSAKVITLTGNSAQNPLRKIGTLNFWVNSSDHGLVEMAHMFLLHHWVNQISDSYLEQHSRVRSGN